MGVFRTGIPARASFLDGSTGTYVGSVDLGRVTHLTTVQVRAPAANPRQLICPRRHGGVGGKALTSSRPAWGAQ